MESAENEQSASLQLGFAAKETSRWRRIDFHAPKERFDRVIVDKKVESRDRHLKVLGG